MKSLAMYIRTFKEDHASIVGGIEYTYTNSAIHHRLVLFYLINEILQTEKSPSGVMLRAELKAFLTKYFIVEKEASVNDELHKQFQQLQDIWCSRKIMDFDDKYGTERIIITIGRLFHEKRRFYHI